MKWKEPPRREVAYMCLRVWHESDEPPSIVHSDWGWFLDLDRPSHADSRLADREQVLQQVAEWLDEFLDRCAFSAREAQAPD